MKILILLFSATSMMAAQAVFTLTGPTNIKQGSTATIALTTSGAANPGAFQFTVTTSATDVNGLTATATSALTGTPAKNLNCITYAAGTLTCIASGLNQTTIADGVLVTLNATFGRGLSDKSVTFAIAGLEANATTAAAMAVTAGPSLSISILSLCDVNGDGLVNNADALIVLNQALGLTSQTGCDLNNDGTCNVADLQIVDIAASGGACLAK